MAQIFKQARSMELEHKGEGLNFGWWGRAGGGGAFLADVPELELAGHA